MLFYRRKSSGFVKTGNRKWFYFIKWYWDVREARGSRLYILDEWTVDRSEVFKSFSREIGALM